MVVKSLESSSYIKLAALIFVSCIFYMHSPNLCFGRIMSILLVFLSFYPIYVSAIKRQLIFVCTYSFMGWYAITPMFYFVFGKQLSVYTQCASMSVIYITTLVMLIFYIPIFCFFNIPPLSKGQSERFLFKNKNIVYICEVIIVLIILFAKTGDSIFTSGGYVATIKSQEGSFWNEYAVIFFMTAIIFNDDKLHLKFLYILFFFYSVHNLLLGGRVQMLMVAMAFLVTDLQYKISFKKLLVFMAAGFLFMQFWGQIRGNGIITFQHVKQNSNIVSSNASLVFYASMRVVYLVENSIISSSESLYSFINFIESIVVPYSYLPDIANLSSYLKKSYGTGGGGLAPIFFYAWIGWLGAFMLGLFTVYITNKLFTTKNIFLFFYGTLFFATVSRWYAYYPAQLIKLNLYGIFFLYVFMSFFKMAESNSDTTNNPATL